MLWEVKNYTTEESRRMLDRSEVESSNIGNIINLIKKFNQLLLLPDINGIIFIRSNGVYLRGPPAERLYQDFCLGLPGIEPAQSRDPTTTIYKSPLYFIGIFEHEHILARPEHTTMGLENRASCPLNRT